MILMKNRLKGVKVFDILPWGWMLAGFLYNIWYQIYPGKYILDADLASEMVLADMLNSSGEILSENWFYSSELRVFQSQWFYRIGLLIFPDNWHCARIVAAALILIVFAVAIIIFARLAGMGKYSVWCGAILMWPFGRWYLVYGLYGTYYIIYMLFSLITVSILMLANRKRGIKVVFLYLAGAFFAFASGLNGVKQTLVFFAPLLVTVIMLLLLAIREKKTQTCKAVIELCGREVRLLLQAVLFIVCNAAGYLVNSRILSQIYSFKEFNELVWAWELPNKLYDVWLDFFLLFGHQREMKVVSVGGFTSVLGIIVGATIAFSIIRLFKHYKNLCMEQKFILLLVVSSLIVVGSVFCFIGEYKQYYWLPLFPFVIAILLIELQAEHFYMKHAREALLLGIIVCITSCSITTVKHEMESPLFGQVGYNQVADWLLTNGYTQGYALFWNSNVLREMSDGQIETWTIYSGENDFIYEWLQEKEHTTTKPKEPYFLFVNSRIGGGPENYRMVLSGDSVLVYEDDPFYIYIFDSSTKEQSK